MLTKSESLKLQKLQTIVEKDNIVSEILSYENKFQKNSLEVYKIKDNLTNEIMKWQILLDKLIYQNGEFYKINKINPVNYISYTRKLKFSEYASYFELVEKYHISNPNLIFIITNYDKFYCKIISELNHLGIMTILISNDANDKYLEFTNLIVCISQNVKEDFKKLHPKAIKFAYEGEI